METRTVEPKTILFREGEAGGAAYIIRSGSVEILKHADHGDVQLAILQEGDVLGEMALFEPRNVRSATARTLNEVTLEVIDDTLFASLLARCPDQLQTIIYTILQRLRETNQRLAAKERATVILDQSVEQLTIAAASEEMAASLKEPMTIKVATLPLSIGGYPQAEHRPHQSDLEIACDGPPLMVSQKHARVERHEDGVFVVDLGSRFCTVVNGKVIGRGKVSSKAPLQLGENKVTLGDHTSNYKLTIVCE